MGNRLVLIAGVIMLPLIYGGFMTVYTTWFQKQSRERRPLFCAIPECLVILSAEAAFLGIWRARTVDPISVMMFWLLFVMLAAMTVFCVIDYREQVVPNCFLMILLLVFALIIGVAGLKHIDVVLAMVPAMVLGFVSHRRVCGWGCFLWMCCSGAVFRNSAGQKETVTKRLDPFCAVLVCGSGIEILSRIRWMVWRKRKML